MSETRARRVWVTRAEPGASATASRLRAMGAEPVVAPLLEVRPIAGVVIDLSDVAALAFTSARAVEAFAPLAERRDLPVFAVGDATAAAARTTGFAEVASAGADGAALARLILAHPRPGVVLHPCAREPAFDLGAALLAGGQSARAVAIYETAVIAAPPAEMIADAVLIQSPKAGRALAGFAQGLPIRRMAAYALSEACAEPLRPLGFDSLAVAPFPTEAALLKLLS